MSVCAACGGHAVPLSSCSRKRRTCPRGRPHRRWRRRLAGSRSRGGLLRTRYEQRPNARCLEHPHVRRVAASEVAVADNRDTGLASTRYMSIPRLGRDEEGESATTARASRGSGPTPRGRLRAEPLEQSDAAGCTWSGWMLPTNETGCWRSPPGPPVPPRLSAGPGPPRRIEPSGTRRGGPTHCSAYERRHERRDQVVAAEHFKARGLRRPARRSIPPAP